MQNWAGKATTLLVEHFGETGVGKFHSKTDFEETTVLNSNSFGFYRYFDIVQKSTCWNISYSNVYFKISVATSDLTWPGNNTPARKQLPQFHHSGNTMRDHSAFGYLLLQLLTKLLVAALGYVEATCVSELSRRKQATTTVPPFWFHETRTQHADYIYFSSFLVRATYRSLTILLRWFISSRLYQNIINLESGEHLHKSFRCRRHTTLLGVHLHREDGRKGKREERVNGKIEERRG